MAKILKFPDKKELKIKEEEKERDEIMALSDECIEASHFSLDLIEEVIKKEFPNFREMWFRDETMQESRDMFIVVNILNAMFNRYLGIPHTLHKDMDNLYIKIKSIDKQRQEDFEIMFTPDFNIDPEDFDDSD